MAHPATDDLFRSAEQRLRAANRRLHLVAAGRHLLAVAGWWAMILVAFTGIDAVLDLATPARLGVWAIALVLLTVVLVRGIAPALRLALRPGERELDRISRHVGRVYPAVADALVNFLQLARERGIAGDSAIRQRSLMQLHDRFGDLDFGAVVRWETLRPAALRFVTAGGLFLLIFLLFPATAERALLKLAFPTRSYAQPLPVTLANASGDLQVLKNDPVTLSGRYDGLTPSRLWLVIEPLGGDSLSGRQRLDVPLGAGRRFAHDLAHVQGDFRYWFEARVELAAFRDRPARSAAGVVSVRERPYIREVQVKLNYPDYTGLEPEYLPVNDGEVSALRGTRVAVELQSDAALSSAAIVLSDTVRHPMELREQYARGGFVVERDDQYFLEIANRDGIPNYQPVRYAVFALPDEVPFVEIARPGKDVDLGDNLDLPLLMNLRDDFGFSRLLLKGRHIRAGSTGDTVAFETAVPMQRVERGQAIADYAWDLKPFYLVPDDFIEYYAEVWDNDRVAGPKAARSQTFVVRLPSLIDILEHGEEALAEQIEETGEVARQAEELREKLEEINREMKREQELSWERKQEIQEQIDTQKKAFEKLEEIQKALEEMTQSLDDQQMLSPETLEKYFELQKMLEDIATPEMREAMEKLQQALEQQDMEQLRQAMEEFEFSAEQFEQNIERSYELFKRIEMEQKMDELVAMAEKLAQDQKAINEQLEQEPLDADQREQLANQEQNVERNTEFFEERLDQARQDFEKEMAEVAQEMLKAQEYMAEQQPTQNMQEMQEQIRQDQMSDARKSGQQLQQQMEMLQSMMQQSRQKMVDQQKGELVEAMQKVQRDLLRASFDQEQLARRSATSDMASTRLNDIARDQARVRGNTLQTIADIIEISKQTFFLSNQLNQIMAGILDSQSESLQGLANRNPRGAGRSQLQAMSGLNQAILSMQSSMEQLSMSGSASGFEQMMQQLQQMAGQQGQLNQQTMDLFQQQQSGGMQPGSQMLQRLRAQQEMIRQSMEQLGGEMGNRGDVPGRLGELAGEMEEVVRELERQRIDPRVIERQQRILSRMLDAQKSVREREYSRKRQAERDDPALAKSPPELKRELLERENRLRQELMESLNEGYSEEYKEFIRSYYEILSRQNADVP